MLWVLSQQISFMVMVGETKLCKIYNIIVFSEPHYVPVILIISWDFLVQVILIQALYNIYHHHYYKHYLFSSLSSYFSLLLSLLSNSRKQTKYREDNHTYSHKFLTCISFLSIYLVVLPYYVSRLIIILNYPYFLSKAFFPFIMIILFNLLLHLPCLHRFHR